MSRPGQHRSRSQPPRRDPSSREQSPEIDWASFPDMLKRAIKTTGGPEAFLRAVSEYSPDSRSRTHSREGSPFMDAMQASRPSPTVSCQKLTAAGSSPATRATSMNKKTMALRPRYHQVSPRGPIGVTKPGKAASRKK